MVMVMVMMMMMMMMMIDDDQPDRKITEFKKEEFCASNRKTTF